ncbi:MAG TPA: Asd/ArgC dimerization domain-containing protein, partial [Kofleriaceae bacterium]|nr:Asd/ArgC dimerization domain-containing protein [Kofleriaceae bacterium]
MDVALFGAAGYAGLELVKLLAVHPHARLVCAASDTHAGKPIARLIGAPHPLAFVRTAEARTARHDVALLAIPPEPARELAAALSSRVVDLSNAHRATHPYGLASLFAADLAEARIVANPGCYATCAITALAPLVRHGVVDGHFAVSAGSGVTGAGKTASEDMSLGEMYGEVRAYKVLRHQHVPEIETALARLGKPAAQRVVLTTHLLPVARGIFMTITATLARALPADAYRAFYADDPTVTIVDT